MCVGKHSTLGIQRPIPGKSVLDERGGAEDAEVAQIVEWEKGLADSAVRAPVKSVVARDGG